MGEQGNDKARHASFVDSPIECSGHDTPFSLSRFQGPR